MDTSGKKTMTTERFFFNVQLLLFTVYKSRDFCRMVEDTGYCDFVFNGVDLQVSSASHLTKRLNMRETVTLEDSQAR